MSYDQPPPPPPPGYGAAPQPPYGGPPPGTSQKAVWSLVTGILSLFCCGLVLGIVAIVLSRSAKAEIASTGKGGGGMAQAGLVTGIVGVIFFIVQIILISTGAFELSFEAG